MTADLLLELRCEELPPRDLRGAARSLEAALGAALRDAGLPPSSTAAAWSPRRIAVWAHGVPERSPDREERVRGPRIASAFDASGAPTRACEGFARKHGLGAAELEREGDNVVAVVRTPGRRAAEVAAEVLPGLPAKVVWKKTMRWGGPVAFARPIRGVVALLGTAVVDCEVAGLRAGRSTRGHPFLAPRSVEIADARRGTYVEALRSVSVLADPDERCAAVLRAARSVAPGIAPRPDLVEEVTNLVEWPSALLGTYDARFLELPPKLLVTVMEHHQRFFPVHRADGSLENRFVAILDRPESSADVARRGFERVLVPRLHDAVFFFEEDRRERLDARQPKLANVTYHRKLGSLRDKADRLSRLARGIAPHVHADPGLAARAGLLAKCDLVTLLVGEFPELQGHVGSVYARLDGEDPQVAEALDWQYRHDFDDDVRPSAVALALLVAENLDILCMFGLHVGLPSGSTDPFGVRRAALTLLDALERWADSIDLESALSLAIQSDAGSARPIADYLSLRLLHRFRDRGAPPDHLDAITSWKTVGEFRQRVDDLRALAALPQFDRLLEVAERCRNITKKSDAPSAPVRPDLLTEPAETSLWETWRPLRDSLPAAPAPLSRADVERLAATLAGPLHTFFEKVYVNADDPAVRANRHALLREIDATLLRFADLCRVVRKPA